MKIKPSELRHERIAAKQLSEIVGVTSMTLWNWRLKGLPFHKYDTGVYYILDEVLEWMKTQPKLIETYILTKRKLEE